MSHISLRIIFVLGEDGLCWITKSSLANSELARLFLFTSFLPPSYPQWGPNVSSTFSFTMFYPHNNQSGWACVSGPMSPSKAPCRVRMELGLSDPSPTLQYLQMFKTFVIDPKTHFVCGTLLPILPLPEDFQQVPHAVSRGPLRPLSPSRITRNTQSCSGELGKFC